MSSHTGTVDVDQPDVSGEPEQPGPPAGAGWRTRAVELLRRLSEANVFVVTVCAIFAGLVVGAILILVTSPTVLQAWGNIGSNPGHAFGESWSTVAAAYSALLEGSIFNPHAQNLTQAFNPISETLVAATPLMLAGLGVGLGFSTGVFNIGGQGQLIAGAVAALWVGTEIKAPIGIHIPLVILAGAAGGAVAGFIPGILKATTGAHEVITTIMLNYIFLDLLDWLLTVAPLQQPGQSNAISKTMPATARMPHLFGSGLRVNVSLLVALAMALVVWWLMRRSRLGFSFKVIGLNPDAGKTAGMDARLITVLVLTISGALVGMAGMATLSGTDFFLSTNYGGETGFNAITVALLGRNSPGGIVLGSLLFAALISGGRNMQAVTGIPIDLTTVIQAVIVFMVATPALVKEVFRLHEAPGAEVRIATKGWTA
ncbi:MAG TPA: ABC transporter permease [Acidimicrobiales bacterium]|nr:ABC transporter permease [Acidimicrobiales bacterium]